MENNPPQIAPNVSQHHHFRNLHTKIHQEKNLFPGQRPTEIVKLLIQNHWIADVKIFLGFLCLPIVILGIVFFFFIFFGLDQMPWWNSVRVIFSLTLLIIWLVVFIEVLKNELSIIFVTNERIVDMIQTSLFSHKSSETSLDRVQDVIGFTRGFVGTFLDIGEIEIETAGRELAFVTRNVKSPQLTARRILEIQRESGFKRKSDASSTASATPTPNNTLQKRSGDKLSDTEIMRLRKIDRRKT